MNGKLHVEKAWGLFPQPECILKGQQPSKTSLITSLVSPCPFIEIRMWMVDSSKTCDRHLLGEHNEIHMLVGSISRKRKLTGFLEKHIIEPASVKRRHDTIALEMARRGFRHNSPILYAPDLSYLGELSWIAVDSGDCHEELISRCDRCLALVSRAP